MRTFKFTSMQPPGLNLLFRRPAVSISIPTTIVLVNLQPICKIKSNWIISLSMWEFDMTILSRMPGFYLTPITLPSSIISSRLSLTHFLRMHRSNPSLVPVLVFRIQSRTGAPFTFRMAIFFRYRRLIFYTGIPTLEFL